MQFNAMQLTTIKAPLYNGVRGAAGRARRHQRATITSQVLPCNDDWFGQHVTRATLGESARLVFIS